MKGKFRFTEDKEVLTDEDKAIMNGDIAIYIFKDLDRIIELCSHKRQPVKFNDSQFKKEYEKLKERYVGGNDE